MRILCEVSNPHYHPGPDFDMKVSKKRDLSVPPHWVADQRIHKTDEDGDPYGQSYAIVMPPRDEELWEDRQAVHIHCDDLTYKKLGGVDLKIIKVKGRQFMAKVKVSLGYVFEPVIHFDHVDAEKFGIENGLTYAEVETP